MTGTLAPITDLLRISQATVVLAESCIAVLLSLATLYMLARVPETAHRNTRRIWLAGAAVIAGWGMWTLHFVDLIRLAAVPLLSFNAAGALLSMAICITGMLGAFYLLFANIPRWRQVLGAGTVFGLTTGLVELVELQSVATPTPMHLGFGDAVLLLVLTVLPGIPTAWAASHLDRRWGRYGCALAVVATTALVHTVGTGFAEPLPVSEAHRLTVSLPGLLVGDVIGGCAMIAILTFVSGIKDRDLAARSSAETRRLRQFKEATLEGLVIHRHGTVLDWNSAFCRVAQAGGAAFQGRALSELVGLVHPALAEVSEEPTELSIPGANARSLEVLTRPLEFDGRPALITAIRDVTERRQAEARIQFLAHHDVLTGLANRSTLENRITEAIRLARRTERVVALLYLDLDRFKMVNDLMGHGVGDQVLRDVASRLSALVRNTDTIARLGGDEFVIVQQDVRMRDDTDALARRIISSLSDAYDIDGQSVEIGVSVGVAFAGMHTTPTRLLYEADVALYRAKQSGRGTVCFFQASMDAHLQDRRALEQDLRQALGTAHLRLCYQPQYSCMGDLLGFEALIRWNHPQRGPISPTEFIPLAEDSGLIMQLGEWILRTACAEGASWPLPLTVSVNLSPVQFRRPDLAGLVEDILRETGLPPARLVLEVTEGVFLENTSQVQSIITRLKEMRVRLTLDDFGVGYSSLSYLRDFPFDGLKIDRAFIRQTQDGKQNASILQAIVSLGHALGMEVVAEGVETVAQLELLRSLVCDAVQGYLTGRPVEADAVRDHVSNRSRIALPAARARVVAA